MGGEIPVEDVYVRLARHLEHMIMGYPYDDALLDLLKEMFSPVEAQRLPWPFPMTSCPSKW